MSHVYLCIWCRELALSEHAVIFVLSPGEKKKSQFDYVKRTHVTGLEFTVGDVSIFSFFPFV